MPDPAWLAARARDLRSHPTDAERTLWRSLRQRRFAGHKFRRQVPLGDYIADFACLEARLLIEVDGAHHIERRAHDDARDAWLHEQGFRVLRFTDGEVLTAIGGVESAVWLALEGDTPHPNPPPHGGRGPEADA